MMAKDWVVCCPISSSFIRNKGRLERKQIPPLLRHVAPVRERVSTRECAECARVREYNSSTYEYVSGILCISAVYNIGDISYLSICLRTVSAC